MSGEGGSSEITDTLAVSSFHKGFSPSSAERFNTTPHGAGAYANAYLQIDLGHDCGGCSKFVYGAVTQGRAHTASTSGTPTTLELASSSQWVTKFRVLVTNNND